MSRREYRAKNYSTKKDQGGSPGYTIASMPLYLWDQHSLAFPHEE